MRYVLALAVLFLFTAGHAAANKPIASVERKTVGEAVEIKVVPDLSLARSTDEGLNVWTHNISLPGASFVKAHFVNLNLRAGDRLVLINGLGREVEALTGRGPKDRGTFWGLSGQGDNLALRFEFTRPYSVAPFTIDRVIAGNKSLLAPRIDSGERSICSPGDFEDAICYQGDTGKWDNVRASVGVMAVGGNAATAMYCSGSNVSGANAILSNQHCVESQASCDNTEFVFEMYRTQCGVSSSALSEWQSYRCDEMLASEPLVNCDAGPGDLDFALTTVIGDPASTFGFADVDPAPLTSGEEIYIVQHPDGRPHEITIGSGPDVVVDGTVLRYYNTLDTEGGSSGSPIYRASDNRLVGLHHCGGCSSPGVGNRGMLMSDIYPLISEFLCTNGATDLRVGGSGNLLEVAGNGDATVDPGETWSFVVTATNTSCDLASAGVTAQVSVSSGSAVLANTSIAFGDIVAGQSAAGEPVVFTVPADAPCGESIVFDVDGLSNQAGDSFAGQVATLAVTTGEQMPSILSSEDFSNGLIQWTVEDGGTGTGPAATWTIDNPGGRNLSLTAPYAIVDSDQHGSGTTMDEGLISPPTNVTGFESVLLEFVHDFNHYSGGQSERGDVEVRSAQTAGTWVNVATFADGDTSGAVSIDVTDYAGDDLQVRFHYYNASYEWWWAVDDVTLVGITPNSCTVFGADTDGDGVQDAADNCTLIANADQTDADGDNYGNACDADLNNDGVINVVDLGLLRSLFFTTDAVADLNSDGVVNVVDLGILRSQFFGAPGPSGTAQ
ncbi:MAG: trypsin-like peptidase domain-containing protein [Gammaproteobacteria bacterium]